jgi:hypothetical protein
MKKLGMRGASFGLALALMMPPQVQRDRLEEYKSRFDKENDPIRKAKLIEKLGDYQFDHVRQEVQAGDIDQSLSTLTGYRHESLRATGVDAEKKPSGFKQLEFSVRESLTRLEDIMAGLPKDDQKRFTEIRNELQGLDHQLILELFPRQTKPPGKETAKP